MADAALILGLAGVIVTGAVGVAAPAVAARFSGRQQERALKHEAERQERAFQHERTMRDEEELRAVLDEVAALLDHCSSAVHAAEGRFIVHGRKIGQDEEARTALVASGDANLRLSRAAGRLAIRLGKAHPLKLTAVEAHNAIAKATGAIGSIAFMGDEADLSEYTGQIREGREEFERARSTFVDVASAYAGSRLPRQLDLELGFKPGELAARRNAAEQPPDR